MPKVGFAIAHSSSISLNLFAPISISAIWCSALSLNNIRGTPMWLFKFPIVERTAYFWDKTQLINSFVLVLPLLPVIPITGMSNLER